MKLVPLKNRFKDLSNDIWITKIGLKMRTLRPFKFGARIDISNATKAPKSGAKAPNP